MELPIPYHAAFFHAPAARGPARELHVTATAHGRISVSNAIRSDQRIFLGVFFSILHIAYF